LKQQDLGDNWQINVHKNFILYLKTAYIISQTYENTVKLRMTKAKIRLCKFFEFCIL
jgi:hypothetical protein